MQTLMVHYDCLSLDYLCDENENPQVNFSCLNSSLYNYVTKALKYN